LMLSVVVGSLNKRNMENNMTTMNFATAGWCLAFAIFLWVYWPVLTRPSVKS